MRFKHHAVAGAAGVQLGLIITPMLDMCFQVLAYFIMIYNPSPLEGQIPGLLAPADKLEKKDKEMPKHGKVNVPSKEPPPKEVPPPLPVPTEEELVNQKELNEAIKVYIKAGGDEPKWRKAGMPSHYFIKTPLDPEPKEIGNIDQADAEKIDHAKWDEVMLKRLETELGKLGSKGSRAHLKIEGDADLRQQYVLSAYDAG